MSDEFRRIAREELERQKQADQFWARLHEGFPITRGHQELAKDFLAKNMAHMADMDQEEGVEYLGEALEKEINRRARRDVENRESMVFAGGLEHGHRYDSRTGETLAPDHDDNGERPTHGDVIRARRESRLQAQRKWEGRTDDHRKRRGAST